VAVTDALIIYVCGYSSFFDNISLRAAIQLIQNLPKLNTDLSFTSLTLSKYPRKRRASGNIP
jgi:hypothetical protein